MSTTQKVWTYDDLFDLPDDGRRWEIIDGELVEMSAPDPTHQRILFNLLVLFGRFLEQFGRDDVVLPAPTDVCLGASTVQPDVVYFTADRWERRRPGRAIEDVPDLLVEIVSPSNRTYDEETKFRLYAEAGVPEYWLVYPQERRIQMFTLDAGTYVPAAAVERTLASRVLVGLRVDPADVFKNIPSQG